MSDIIERLENANGELLMVGNDFSDPLLDAATEIKSLRQQVDDAFDEKQILRQRVQELEGAVKFHRETNRNMAMDFEEELAALKAGQGEPVARWNWGQAKLEWLVPYQAGFNMRPMFFAAPTIPKGWQLVPIEPVGVVQMVSIAGTPMPDSRGVDWLKSIPAGTKLYTAAPTGERNET